MASLPSWIGDRRFGVATKAFGVATRAFCGGNRGWSRPGFEVTTWLGWAGGRDIILRSRHGWQQERSRHGKMAS